eukprot:GDKJ01012641.1.p1 GENE.GDKJ01012641.1~~GDKJ01012641.1.p1  ORF type:complete len:432 (-),score=86.69 GDKJ01012641.1:673-1968(-)
MWSHSSAAGKQVRSSSWRTTSAETWPNDLRGLLSFCCWERGCRSRKLPSSPSSSAFSSSSSSSLLTPPPNMVDQNIQLTPLEAPVISLGDFLSLRYPTARDQFAGLSTSWRLRAGVLPMTPAALVGIGDGTLYEGMSLLVDQLVDADELLQEKVLSDLGIDAHLESTLKASLFGKSDNTKRLKFSIPTAMHTTRWQSRGERGKVVVLSRQASPNNTYRIFLLALESSLKAKANLMKVKSRKESSAKGLGDTNVENFKKFLLDFAKKFLAIDEKKNSSLQLNAVAVAAVHQILSEWSDRLANADLSSVRKKGAEDILMSLKGRSRLGRSRASQPARRVNWQMLRPVSGGSSASQPATAWKESVMRTVFSNLAPHTEKKEHNEGNEFSAPISAEEEAKIAEFLTNNQDNMFEIVDSLLSEMLLGGKKKDEKKN